MQDLSPETCEEYGCLTIRCNRYQHGAGQNASGSASRPARAYAVTPDPVEVKVKMETGKTAGILFKHKIAMAGASTSTAACSLM